MELKIKKIMKKNLEREEGICKCGCLRENIHTEKNIERNGQFTKISNYKAQDF
ncbi:MAG: hypothetical protein ACFE9C_06265 [Candidatus Hodarchaeota archaeon]